ncbi:MAG: tonB-system energizer ExbB [Hyphomicrobiales bacterium]|nr:tonB-system energizer ExbB [Hyphomicrobiales bacterium]
MSIFCSLAWRIAVVGAASHVTSSLAMAQDVNGDLPAALLPQDLSPLGMFLAAHVVVKAVMLGLAFASVVTWTVGLAKFLQVAFSRRRLRAQIAIIHEARDFEEVQRTLDGRGQLEACAAAASKEMQLSRGYPDKGAIRERIVAEIERVVAAHGMEATKGMGALATIGATAPFVGLFGTVWGIMNAFIGISHQHTTNLAVVAPGIAEALLATALGLVAAIPAVVIYNFLSRQIGAYRALYASGGTGLVTLCSRALDRDRLVVKQDPRVAAE